MLQESLIPKIARPTPLRERFPSLEADRLANAIRYGEQMERERDEAREALAALTEELTGKMG